MGDAPKNGENTPETTGKAVRNAAFFTLRTSCPTPLTLAVRLIWAKKSTHPSAAQ
jgi:hypothetical protein